MKQFFIAFLAITTFFACKKDNDKDNDQPAGSRLVEQRTGDDYVKLEYGANGKVNKAIVLDEDFTNSEEVTYNISYNAAGRISEVLSSNNEVFQPVYENGRLTKATIMQDNQEIGSTEYTYENGLVKDAIVKFKVFDVEMVTMKFSFTYDAQQRVNQSRMWIHNPITNDLELAGHTEIEYDSKKNPLYDFSDFMLLMWEIPAVNNVVKETEYDSDNEVDEIRDFNYTYNADQYPVQAVMSTSVRGEVWNTILEFKYN